MNRKLLSNIKIISALLASTLLVGGCTNASTNSTTTSVVENHDSITLEEENISLILGDTYKLQPKVFTTKTETLSVKYKSQNTSIVSVDEDGNLTSLKVGRTVVDLSYGDASTRVTVAVILGDYRPYIRFENIYTDEITVDLGTSIDVSAYVFFNSKKYYPDLGYELSNLSAGMVDEHFMYTPNKAGKYKVTVCGTFNNYELEDLTLTINVVSNLEFALSKKGESKELSNISLCSISSYKENSYQNSIEIEGFVTDKGVKKPVTSISVVDDAYRVVSFDKTSGRLSATGVGKGEAYIVLSYTDETGKTYNSQRFPVYVDYPCVPYDNEPIYEIGVKNGTFDLDSIFASFPAQERQLVEARSVDGKTNYKVDEDGKISGLTEDTSNIQTILLSNGKILQEVKYIAYAGVISNAEDLNMFNTASKTGNYKDILDLKITGKYVVLNDFDAEGFILQSHDRIAGDSLTSFVSCGFVGEFDGRGHTISNLKFSKGGLFGAIGSGAVVHNIGFENARYDAYNAEDRHILATYINNATIENLYVHIDRLARTNAAGLICHDMNINSAFMNSLIIVDGEGIELNNTNGYGAFSSFANPRKSYGNAPAEYLKDTYFVSALPLIKGQSYTNTKLSNAYYCDVQGVNYSLSYNFKGVDEDGQTIDTTYEIPKFTIPHAKHYLTMEAFNNANNNYSSFNSEYWNVTNDKLSWRI